MVQSCGFLRHRRIACQSELQSSIMKNQLSGLLARIRRFGTLPVFIAHYLTAGAVDLPFLAAGYARDLRRNLNSALSKNSAWKWR